MHKINTNMKSYRLISFILVTLMSCNTTSKKSSAKEINYIQNNQVYDEWIVRDQGAMVRQLGFKPKEFAQMIINKEGGADKAQQLFNSNSEIKSDYKQSVVPDDSAGGKYS